MSSAVTRLAVPELRAVALSVMTIVFGSVWVESWRAPGSIVPSGAWRSSESHSAVMTVFSG